MSSKDTARGQAKIIPLSTPLTDDPGRQPRRPAARTAVRRKGTHSDPVTAKQLPRPRQPDVGDVARAADVVRPLRRPVDQPLLNIGALPKFFRRRLAGDYEVDEFGFDRDLSENVLFPALRLLYRHWFRVKVTGAENVPAAGNALLVANHSGTLPLDALMTALAVHDNSRGRYLRMLGANLVFATPVVGDFARKSGQTVACQADSERLLAAGELVGVWPEGFKGIGKPYRQRYQLQRFGRGGFVSSAVRTAAPIIPVSIVGAEEIYPKIADIKPLAKLLGLPYFPITPLFPALGPFGAIPLPSQWRIHFGTPVSTAELARAEVRDPMAEFELADEIKMTIQRTLRRLTAQRNGIFF